ncbi:haloacid dehalogenase superfamily, subfamily IA, variant 3 with third motif having DD or ED [Nonomuraea wenchangensis]|uniref:Haloacid dehalogenase superfamily, subfamily IA, variant 3 with third motif having DD or ED n=1 Tax=Nonomuraea wenchangensis TaxID=568860 RepID=A0A1I0FRE7_9ACTN|nr:haloacid dehalogenase superfamily, subfamily IA, variant 3 with third motif having DD or ED [Nonomuraea wenchangensis]
MGACVFDLDGVLVDSEPVWEEVRRAFVAEHGGTWQPDTQSRLMGMSTGEWAAYLHELGVRLTPDEIARGVVDRMTARYRDEVPLMPGAVEAVRRLAAERTLGLASSSPRRLIDVVLDAAGLTACFAATVSTEEVERGKPAPDGYLEAARRMGVDPGGCVAVEDSSNGLRSAYAAGMRVIAVPHPRYPPAPDALALAWRVLPDLAALTPDLIP